MSTIISGDGTITGLTSTGISAAQIVSASNITTGTLPSAQLPAGSVLQVVSTTLNTTFSTASTSFTDLTGLSVTITPKSASNKILIFVTSYQSNSTTGGLTTYNLVRNSTNICQPSTTPTFAGTAACYTSAADNIFPFSISYLDSPSTTSATTYKVQMKSNAGTVYINQRVTADTALTSTITIMEIAA